MRGPPPVLRQISFNSILTSCFYNCSVLSTTQDPFLTTFREIVRSLYLQDNKHIIQTPAHILKPDSSTHFEMKGNKPSEVCI